MASDCECSRLEEREIRTREVKEGVTRHAGKRGYPTPPLWYRYQDEGLANWAGRKCMKTKDGEKLLGVREKVTRRVAKRRGSWREFRADIHHVEELRQLVEAGLAEKSAEWQPIRGPSCPS
jgi:hypothetical protein